MSTIRKVVSQIDVLEISGITIGDKLIKIGEHFAANDDWLGKLTIRIKERFQHEDFQCAAASAAA